MATAPPVVQQRYCVVMRGNGCSLSEVWLFEVPGSGAFVCFSRLGESAEVISQ